MLQFKLLWLSWRRSRLRSRPAPAVRGGAWKNGRLLNERLDEKLEWGTVERETGGRLESVRLEGKKTQSLGD